MHDINELFSKVQAILSLALTVVLLAVSLSAGTGNMIWLGFARSIRSSEVILLLLVFGVLSLWLLLNSTNRSTDEPHISRETELGEIKISAQTLNSLVLLSLEDLEAVEVRQAVVVPGRKGAVAHVSVAVMPSVDDVTETASQIQQRVKNCFSERLGLQVEKVQIKIIDVHQDGRELPVEKEAD